MVFGYGVGDVQYMVSRSWYPVRIYVFPSARVEVYDQTSNGG